MDDFIEFDSEWPSTSNLNFSVDFSQVEIPKNNDDETKNIIEYDNYTREKYRVMRKRNMDPITYEELDGNLSFKFKYRWDPYTGERSEEDQDGPLHFDPDILIKYFHTKRLEKLWVKPSDEQNGFFSGYYDDGVGAGNDFYLEARGYHPEWYLFRLPILDCYLTKDHNKQFITLGPILTDSEIREIDRLANMNPNNYINSYQTKRPSLIEIKRLYDIAISKKHDIQNKNNFSNDMLIDAYSKISRQAVDELIKIKG